MKRHTARMALPPPTTRPSRNILTVARIEPRRRRGSFALTSIAGIWHGARHLDPAALMQFGALVMIATPVLRVAFAIVAFFLERDWLYTGISAVVLLLLLWSLRGTF